MSAVRSHCHHPNTSRCIRSAAAMPMRGALRAAIVVTQHVTTEITFEVAPHRVDMVAA